MTIKVCGMRDADNLRRVEQLGVEMIGFICWEKSSRYIASPPSYLPVSARRVGVFVNASPEFIIRQTQSFSFDYIQLHGDETPDDCHILLRLLNDKGIKAGLLKAIGIGTADDMKRTEDYGFCQGFIFDTRCNDYGGSGRSFDWELLEHYQGKQPFLLSGGIGPASLQALTAFHHPRWAGVDLNSRFETEPGMKDITLLQSFISRIHHIQTPNII